MTHLTQQPSRRGWLPWEFSIFLSRFFFLSLLPLSFSSRESRTPSSTINCFALYISKTAENKRERRLGEEIKDAASLSLRSPCFAGGLGQLRRVGEADEGAGVGGRRRGQPLHSGHGPGHADVQANSYCQGNGRPGGAGVSCFTPTYVTAQCTQQANRVLRGGRTYCWFFMDIHGHQPYYFHIIVA